MQRDFTIPDRHPLYGLICLYDVRNPDVWILMHDYERTFIRPNGDQIHWDIPAGFRWDSASIPKRFQDVIAKWGKHSTASLIHDWLYDQRIGERSKADLLFYELLRADGVGWLKAQTMYRAVRLGGWKAWADDK